MAYKIRELSGSLFKNKKKTSDKHPNLTGSALIDGVEYWVNAWTKETDNGQKWISLSFKNKDESGRGTSKTREVDEDIPF